MPGTVLENLSGKKLGILVGLLITCQAICFLVGGLMATPPAGSQLVLGSACKDMHGDANDTKRFLTRATCPEMIDFQQGDNEEMNDVHLANRIVFMFQIPQHKLQYSRWQQNLVGVLEADMKYKSDMEIDSRIKLTLDARLSYRNKGDGPNDWKYYASSIEERTIECSHDTSKKDGYLYNCSIIPLFELGSLHHDYYLLNLRLPVDTALKLNQQIGRVFDIWLVAIHQNVGFTKVWVSLKTVFFPLIIATMIWFWRRIHMLQRSPAILEYMLLCLGAALTILNVPFEYLTLYFNMPYMLLLGDIRQGIFYAMLLSFWLVFAGEHMLIQETGERNKLKTYWRHLSAVAIGCVSLFIFDLCERGIQLWNPFYTIWVTDLGANIALTFIIVAGLSAGMYFMFLCYMIWRVFINISIKRSSLPTMSGARRLHYEGIIYRFKFLMLSTVVCAALTIIWFILGQVAEGQWKWDEHQQWEITSSFYTGVYGMWNVYTIALLILYAPSHKQWPSHDTGSASVACTATTTDGEDEEIEFSRLPSESMPTEISSLTAFAQKTSID